MKKLLNIITLICLLFIYGCTNPTLNNNDDDNNNDNNIIITNTTIYIITEKGKWTITHTNNIAEIFFNPDPYSLDNGPQYGALHTDSSYLRLNYGPTSSWGTSIILFPAFWKKENKSSKYYQGAPIIFKARPDFISGALIISFDGKNQGLTANGLLTIEPPDNIKLKASVEIQTQITPSFELDTKNHPDEAFKPAFLSSMRISQNYWDAHNAVIDNQNYEIPFENFILNAPINSNMFGLEGGLSQWQAENQNFPAISASIILDRAMNIQGFVTASNNPNDDNVGLWAAVDTVLNEWGYDIIVSEHAQQSPDAIQDNNSGWR